MEERWNGVQSVEGIQPLTTLAPTLVTDPKKAMGPRILIFKHP